MKRINVGCGMSPTPGWDNVDNSLSLRLSRLPVLAEILSAFGAIGKAQRSYIEFCRGAGIQYADAVRRLPFDDASAGVIYSSHMLEHLSRKQAVAFLAEARRVLAPGGIIRIAVPDLAMLHQQYRQSRNADDFIEGTLMAYEPPETLGRRIRDVIAGPRHHLWMYDGPSLIKLLTANGFEKAETQPPGSTTIPDPGALNLYEREGESVYVEARRPA